jgi:hypothetical protein
VFWLCGSTCPIVRAGLARSLDAYNRVSSGSLTIEDFESAGTGIDKKPIAQLIRDIGKHVKIEGQSVPDTVERALRTRDFLVHRLLLERSRKFNANAGRTETLAEVISIERLLDAERITINAMRIAMCRTLGVPESPRAQSTLAVSL